MAPENPITEETLYGNVEEVSPGVTQGGADYANITLKADHLNWGTKVGVFSTTEKPTLVQDALALSVGARIGVRLIKKPMPNGQGHFRNLIEILGGEGGSQPNPVTTSPSSNQIRTAPQPARPSNGEQDRQSMIMLQNASGWIGPAYIEYLKLGIDTPFQVILDDIAQYATTYTYEVYWNKGYTEPQIPEEPVDEPAPPSNNDREVIAEEGWENNPF